MKQENKYVHKNIILQKYEYEIKINFTYENNKNIMI